MGNITSSQPQVSARDRAVLDLKLQRDKIQKRLVQVRAAAGREDGLARDCLRRGDRDRAKLALARKRFQTAILANADAQLAELERLVDEVEFALIRKDVLFGIAQGTAALRDVQKQMGGVEGVEMVMKENEDAIAYQQELDNMVSSGLAATDIAAVDAELDEMESELIASKLAKVPTNQLKHVDLPLAEQAKEEPQEDTEAELEYERQLVAA